MSSTIQRPISDAFRWVKLNPTRIAVIVGLLILTFSVATLALSRLSRLALPSPVTASASLIPGHSLIARIEGRLDMPGDVYVEYWSADGGEVLRTPVVASSGTDYAVLVARLRAETVYEYAVYGTADATEERSAALTGSFATGPLPEGLAGTAYTVISGRSSHDLTLMDFNSDAFRGIVGIDGEGHIVWYYDAGDHMVGDITLKPDGNIIYVMEYAPAMGFGLREITPQGDEVAVVDADCELHGTFHHEVFMLPEERVMVLGRHILPYGDPAVPQEGDTIWTWDQRTGEVEQVWSVFDFVPLEDRTPASDRTLADGNVMWGGCDADHSVQDWTHGNSLYLGPDGNILFSARHLDQVMSIAPDFGSLQWRLGGPGSHFHFPEPADRFYHQHSATPLPSGSVLLFDNGNVRPAEEGGAYSRALELELDFVSMEARKVWEYRHDPDLFAACCSNVQRLVNGNTLVVFGSNFQVDICCRIFTIVEADTEGRPVWVVEQTSPTKEVQYRAYATNSLIGEWRVER